MPRAAACMIDLSGTVHVGDSLLPGAREAVQLLVEHKVELELAYVTLCTPQVPFLFVTNNSAEPVSHVAARLGRGGLAVSPGQIFTSLSAARGLGGTGAVDNTVRTLAPICSSLTSSMF